MTEAHGGRVRFPGAPFQNIYKIKIVKITMPKKESDKMDIKNYSNYIIGIVALVLSFFNPLPGLVLGIIGLVRVGKRHDRISKKARTLNIIAIIVAVVFAALSIILTLIKINWGALSY